MYTNTNGWQPSSPHPYIVNLATSIECKLSKLAIIKIICIELDMP